MSESSGTVELFMRLAAALPNRGVAGYSASYALSGDGAAFAMARIDGVDTLVVDGPAAGMFEGALTGGLLLCPCTHANRLALNAALPWTAPRALGRTAATIGLGDRLGTMGAAQLAGLSGTRLLPVPAQQSMREMSLTGRTFDDVIDAASFAALCAGWRAGFGADGDHLKCMGDIRAAVAAGCSMITLDCSDVLNLQLETRGEQEGATIARYRGDVALRSLNIDADEAALRQTMRVYDGAVAYAAEVWREILQPAGREIDFELSLDETSERTTPLAHYYVSDALSRRGVTLTSLAPRFVGKFHKGVDYIGSTEAFAADLAMHARIADLFGHKLSLHSGSDKFSIFGLVAPATGGRFHLKTSGTSWLVAVRTLARHEPGLYRRIHACAREHFGQARAYYHVDAEPGRIPNAAALSDARLPGLFDLDDSRQLIHITYGYLIGPQSPLRKAIFAALTRQKSAVDEAVRAHIRTHAEALGMQKPSFSPRLSLTMTGKITGAAPFLYEGDFCEGVRYARRLGYDCVELHVADPAELDMPALLATLAQTGIAVSALGTGRAYVNDGLSLIDDDSARRSMAVARLTRFIDAAAVLGGVVIIGCLRGNVPDFTRYDEYAARLAESVRIADAHARARKVAMVFEPINRYENNYFCSALDVKAFIEENGLTNTRLMLDAFHMNIEEADPVSVIRACAPYLAYYHAADSNRRFPGCGHTDFPAQLAALREIGYNGDISAECLPLPDPDTAARNWLANMKERLRQ